MLYTGHFVENIHTKEFDEVNKHHGNWRLKIVNNKKSRLL